MPPHLPLQEPFDPGQRRQGSGAPPAKSRNPRRHGQALQREFQRAAEQARPRVLEGIDPDLVFKVAGTSRIDESTWARRGLQLLSESQEWTYFVLSPAELPAALQRELAAYTAADDQMGARAPLSTFFGLIEGVVPYDRDDRRGEGLPPDDEHFERLLLDAVIWPSPDEGEAARRVDLAQEVVEETGGEMVAVDGRPRYTTVRARVDREGLDALLELSVVEHLRTPPLPYLDPHDWIEVDAEDFGPREDRPGAAIGILDDAIFDAHPLLDGFVATQRSFPIGYPWQPPGSHGTMVAGLALYGDFEAALRTNTPLVATGELHEARVLEPDPTALDRARFPQVVTEHVVLEEAIRALHADGVRVFNISCNYPYAYGGARPTVLTEMLDSLVRELDILIVASAGNMRTTSNGLVEGEYRLDGFPDYVLEEHGRIAEPAAAALVLSVGSVARSAGPAGRDGRSIANARAVARVNELSPFSRCGPGAGRCTKPEFVAYGGNWVVHANNLVETSNPGVGTVSTTLDPGGRLFDAGSGTSLAAARVTRVTADALTAYRDASANLIRALVGLSARNTREDLPHGWGSADRYRAYGYGMPDSALATESGARRVAMTFEGSIPVDSFAIHPIPIPLEWTRGRVTRRIAVALAFDPPVRRQRREYLAGTMKFELLRNVSVDEIRRIYGRQDPAEREELIRNRRHLDLTPSATPSGRNTLQVRATKRRELRASDGDTYYIVVTHTRQPWANDYEEQRYALAVELVDEERADLDLYALVRARLRVPVRVRVRRR
jgi:hypothetical protein